MVRTRKRCRSGVLRKESTETKEQTGRGEVGHANYKFQSWVNLVFTLVLEMEPTMRRALHRQHHSSKQFKCSMKHARKSFIVWHPWMFCCSAKFSSGYTEDLWYIIRGESVEFWMRTLFILLFLYIYFVGIMNSKIFIFLFLLSLYWMVSFIPSYTKMLH